MSLQGLKLDFAGQSNGVVPRLGRLYDPTSTLAQISTAGYLNGYIQSQNIAVLPTDFIAAVGSDGHQWYKPVFATNGSGVITLTVLP